MHGASFPHATPVRGAPLTRFALNVETRAQAQAIQTFLWCLWLTAFAHSASARQSKNFDGTLVEASTVFDAIGNLTQVVSPGANGSALTKTMTYDIRGRQTSLPDPDAGSYSYVYNGAGEQTEQRDSRSPVAFVTTTQYDAFGRKTSRTETHPLGSGLADTLWSYDCANGKGLMCSVGYSAPTGVANTVAITTKTTSFDLYSRPVATTTLIDGQSFVSSIAYDNQGRPKHAVYPQATSAAAPLALTTSYNAVGQEANEHGRRFATADERCGFVEATEPAWLKLL